MAIGIYFSPESFPVEKYDSTLKDLEGAGAGAPAGRLYHCAMESSGGVHVFDVWESQERSRRSGRRCYRSFRRPGSTRASR